jgi:hypothetical protein
MFKIEGLDKLQREIGKLQSAIDELDGDLGTVSFDPGDPASIDQAIRSMEKMVDDRFSGVGGSELLGSLSDEMKEKYRAGILERAAEARLESDE